MNQNALFHSLLSRTEIRTLQEVLGNDAALHVVGGALRSLMTKSPMYDIDCATVLKPSETTRRLTAHGVRVIPTGVSHGTVTALIENNQIEITTFRTPGARISSEYSQSIEEDLAGRDFTINAMALSVETGRLIDPFGGIDDISQSLLRAVGHAHVRFREDPLRVLRMLRFGPGMGFSLETKTASAASAYASSLEQVSSERKGSELIQILNSPFPHKAFTTARDLDILKHFIPEFIPSVGCAQNKYHIHDVYNHILWVLERAVSQQSELTVKLSALFHDIGKPATVSVDENGERHFYQHEVVGSKITAEVLKRLCLPKQLVNDVEKLVLYHMRPLQCGPAAVRRVMRDLGALVDQWLELKEADKSPLMSEKAFYAEKAHFEGLLNGELQRLKKEELTKLVISGYDLMAIGFEKGPALGRTIRALQEVILDDPQKNKRELLLELAKKMT